MALTPGTRLGPYEILEPIGSGGMGEVYRARDTKLGREVAIKVLPAEFAQDAERLARFEREAKLLASLNHPNIAAIHGFEESDGINALVLELVEGPTLAERIQQGPMPVDEAIAIAKQIAEALEAGHEAGVIHRDLKPANIKLKDDSTVKVLDYGLAKALEGETPTGIDADLSQSPTLTRQGTQVGVILGTAAYMSPEQAKGKRVDKRTDIWAYGAVLYEMLTGRQAFQADDVSSTLAKVIERDPDWRWLPRETPAPVMRLVQRALKKDRTQRIPDIGIARLEIDDALARTAESPQAATAEVATRAFWHRPSVTSAALVLAAVVGGLGFWGMIRSRPDVPPSVVRTSIVVPSQQELSSRGWRQIAISPDGTRLVYTANNQLYLRALDALEAKSLAGTDSGAADPFFSPDGEWIGFYSQRDRALRKVAVSGGGAMTLAEIPPTFGASWAVDGTIVFGQGRGGIHRIAADGGTPEVLVAVEGIKEATYPQMLSDGGAVLFTLFDGSGSRLTVERLATGERTVLVEGGREARFLPTGHLLYTLRDNLLAAVPFDIDRLEVTGDPVELVDSVGEAAMSPQWTVANAAVSQTGVLVYFLGNPARRDDRTPVWVGRDGSVEELGAPPRGYAYPHVSPDGTRVSFDVRDEGRDIWTWDLRREALSRLTLSQFNEGYGLWTADGQRIVFSSNRSGRDNLYWRAADGTGEVERLAESASDQYPHTISPDGTRLVYRDQPGGGRMDLYVFMLDGSGRSEPLITNEFQALNAEISPDGRWLAYQSNDSGRHEIYVRPFPDVEGGRWMISTMGGTRPLWAPNGRELFYLTKDRVMGVEVETEDGFEAGPPAVIVAGSYLGTGSVFSVGGAFGRTYDISRDGQRFLMIQEPRKTDDSIVGLNQIVVVQNWYEELKRLVPTQ